MFPDIPTAGFSGDLGVFHKFVVKTSRAPAIKFRKGSSELATSDFMVTDFQGYIRQASVAAPDLWEEWGQHNSERSPQEIPKLTARENVSRGEEARQILQSVLGVSSQERYLMIVIRGKCKIATRMSSVVGKPLEQLGSSGWFPRKCWERTPGPEEESAGNGSGTFFWSIVYCLKDRGFLCSVVFGRRG